MTPEQEVDFEFEHEFKPPKGVEGVHEVAKLFPMLSRAELEGMANSILTDGLKHRVVVDKVGVLLDGRNRCKACELAGVEPGVKVYEGEDPVAYILAANLKRRNLNESQLATLAVDLLPFYESEAKSRQVRKPENLLASTDANKGKASEQAAKAVGSSQASVERAKAVKKASPELYEKVKAGQVSLHDAQGQLKKAQVLAKRETMAKAAESLAPDERYKVVNGSVEDAGNWVPCDAVITDPPYPREFLSLYGSLAEMSALYLKPNGLCVVMVGQTWLPEVLELMTPHLRYYWCACFDMDKGLSTKLSDRPVLCNWKPLLVFCKKDAKLFDLPPFRDVFDGGGEGEKDAHEWQQNAKGMLNIVSRLCQPGQLVLDPFSGTGSTGVAALQHGCLYHGIELDESTAKASITRLHEVKA